MSASDDEAPEEIALSTGRSQAATLRSQEQAQRKQQSASKRKRKTNDNGSNASESVHQTQTPLEDQAQLDYVPDEVIEALTAADKYESCCQHGCSLYRAHILSSFVAWLYVRQPTWQAHCIAYRASAEAQAPDTADTWQHPTTQPKRQQREQLSERRVGPVTVQVLHRSQHTGAPSGICSFHADRPCIG